MDEIWRHEPFCTLVLRDQLSRRNIRLARASNQRSLEYNTDALHTEQTGRISHCFMMMMMMIDIIMMMIMMMRWWDYYYYYYHYYYNVYCICVKCLWIRNGVGRFPTALTNLFIDFTNFRSFRVISQNTTIIDSCFVIFFFTFCSRCLPFSLICKNGALLYN